MNLGHAIGPRNLSGIVGTVVKPFEFGSQLFPSADAWLDEPTNALDPEVARRFRTLLDGFVRDGGAVLLSTHLLDMAERLCHRVLVMRGGQRVAMGSPPELRARAGLGATASLEDLFFALRGE